MGQPQFKNMQLFYQHFMAISGFFFNLKPDILVCHRALILLFTSELEVYFLLDADTVTPVVFCLNITTSVDQQCNVFLPLCFHGWLGTSFTATVNIQMWHTRYVKSSMNKRLLVIKLDLLTHTHTFTDVKLHCERSRIFNNTLPG